MNRNFFGKLSARLSGSFSRFGRKRLYYAIAQTGWSFYWDAFYITSNLAKRGLVDALMTDNPWKLRNQLIHFGDRYLYFNGPYQRLHHSNHRFLTWFHGDPTDPNPEMRELFELLPDALAPVEKIVVSCEISRKVLMGVGIPEGRIELIPLGVDLGKFTAPPAGAREKIRSDLGIPKDAFCVGSFQKDGVGRGEGNEPKLVKGPDIFLRVVENLAVRCKNLMVVLTGPARGYVRHGLERLHVPYIHHHLSDYHDIVSYYQALDLYIIASRSEGGPKALLESWATGVPVVSTRVGMPADLIRHGCNGMMAEVDDANALAEHAAAIADNAALRERCCRQGLEDVKQYDWPLIAEGYYDKLYRMWLE